MNMTPKPTQAARPWFDEMSTDRRCTKRIPVYASGRTARCRLSADHEGDCA